MNVDELKEIAKQVRRDILQEVYTAHSGHPGSSLSCSDILTVLYFQIMQVDAKNPKREDRDRFVLSKGHAAPALYAVLAEKGFFPKEELYSLRKLGSRLQGHPDMKSLPGIDMTTGSLGQGISAACGMAMACKVNNHTNKIYCLLGDGELQEGEVWEAAMAASHHQLDNLCVIIDNNNLQINGEITKVMNPYPIKDKWESFGFTTFEVDGNNIEDLINVLYEAQKVQGSPVAIIAKTIKGKGVSFMENKAEWHGKAPNEEEYRQAMQELE